MEMDKRTRGEVFRFKWRGRRPAGDGVDDMWISIGLDGPGAWWFDMYFVGRVKLGGAAPHAIRFASWLLATRPAGSYESEFMLVDDQPRSGRPLPAGGTAPGSAANLFTIEFLLNRNDTGGAESLTVLPKGHLPGEGIYFDMCAPLVCCPLDRAALTHSATTLLAIAEEA